MAHIWGGRGTHMRGSCHTHMRGSWYTHMSLDSWWIAVELIRRLDESYQWVTAHAGVSHGTHLSESRRASFIGSESSPYVVEWHSFVGSMRFWVSFVWVSFIWVSFKPYEWVMAHIWGGHGTHRPGSESWHSYEQSPPYMEQGGGDLLGWSDVRSLLQQSHINESWRRYGWVMAHILTRKPFLKKTSVQSNTLHGPL